MTDPRIDDPGTRRAAFGGGLGAPNPALGSEPHLGHERARHEATYGETHAGPDERRHFGEHDVADEHGAWRGAPSSGRGRVANGESSLFGLVSGLVTDVGRLVRKEGELLRTELGEKLDQMRTGAAALASGAFVTYAGVLFLILSAVLALDTALDRPWLSALIVGGLVTLVGLMLLGRGRSNLKASNLTPERSLHSLEKDTELATHRNRESTTSRETTHAHA